MNNSWRILLALVAGLIVGGLVPNGATADTAVATGQAVGTIWIDALKMTIIPLVFGLLVTGIASAVQAARGGRVAMTAMVWFIGLLIAGVILAAVTTEILLLLWPFDASTVAALRAGAAGSVVPPPPSALDMAMGIVPSNIFAALSAGDMLPIVLFACVFGLATARLDAAARDPILALMQGVAAAMMTIVHWVLLIAPIGIFALALAVGHRAGMSAGGAILHYVAIVSLVLIIQMILITYPVAIVAGRVAPLTFIRALLPVQALALSTQSSLASLPVMVAQSREALHLPERTTGLVLPLAVSLFRMTSPAGNLAVVLVVAHIYGISLGWGAIALGAAIAVLGSFAVVGVASTATFFVVLVPLCAALGVPAALLPLLLPVEIFPDLWRTVGNVTADMAVATIVADDAAASKA